MTHEEHLWSINEYCNPVIEALYLYAEMRTLHCI